MIKLSTSFCCLLALLLCAARHALTRTPRRKAMAMGETDARIEALNKAMPRPTTTGRSSRRWPTTRSRWRRARCSSCGRQGLRPGDRRRCAVPDDAEDVINNNRMRGELDNALAALQLFSKDEKSAAQRHSSAAEGRSRRSAPAADREGPGGRDQLQGLGSKTAGLGRLFSASAWAPSCCWWRWAWPSPTG
jgi:hypothetical protein